MGNSHSQSRSHSHSHSVHEVGIACPRCGSRDQFVNVEEIKHSPAINVIERLRKCIICNKLYKTTELLNEHLDIYLADAKALNTLRKIIARID